MKMKIFEGGQIHLNGSISIYEYALKSSDDDVIPADDLFFYRQNPSIATKMEEVYRSLGGLWKMNLIWLHSMKVSWSTKKLSSRPSCVYIYV